MFSFDTPFSRFRLDRREQRRLQEESREPKFTDSYQGIGGEYFPFPESPSSFNYTSYSSSSSPQHKEVGLTSDELRELREMNTLLKDKTDLKNAAKRLQDIQKRFSVQGKQTKDSYFVTVDAPGVDRENVTLLVKGDVLTIKTTRSLGYDKGSYSSKSYSAEVEIPSNVGKLQDFSLDKGVLSIRFSLDKA